MSRTLQWVISYEVAGDARQLRVMGTREQSEDPSWLRRRVAANESRPFTVVSVRRY